MPDTPTSPPEAAICEGALVRLPDGAQALCEGTDGPIGLFCLISEEGRVLEEEQERYLLSAVTLLEPADPNPTIDLADLSRNITAAWPSRRDRAAHAALTGLVASVGLSTPRHTAEQMAERAYDLADAMERAAAAPRTWPDGEDRETDIGIPLSQIDAARDNGGLSDDPGYIALIEQIRAGRKTRLGESAR